MSLRIKYYFALRRFLGLQRALVDMVHGQVVAVARHALLRSQCIIIPIFHGTSCFPVLHGGRDLVTRSSCSMHAHMGEVVWMNAHTQLDG